MYRYISSALILFLVEAADSIIVKTRRSSLEVEQNTSQQFLFWTKQLSVLVHITFCCFPDVMLTSRSNTDNKSRKMRGKLELILHIIVVLILDREIDSAYILFSKF